MYFRIIKMYLYSNGFGKNIQSVDFVDYIVLDTLINISNAKYDQDNPSTSSSIPI